MVSEHLSANGQGTAALQMSLSFCDLEVSIRPYSRWAGGKAEDPMLSASIRADRENAAIAFADWSRQTVASDWSRDNEY